ncbi:hypothetical protein M0804_001453 [Polistes exclamans]|nr:hypothetical protein M0804_001453 [Polistes exclamans]
MEKEKKKKEEENEDEDEDEEEEEEEEDAKEDMQKERRQEGLPGACFQHVLCLRRSNLKHGGWIECLKWKQLAKGESILRNEFGPVLP